jgi:3-hydroxyisobutyrate dehydrogenase-like beta-hydroxyacid dehydrogenase
MTPRIAIVAPGEMGSGIGRRLVQSGLTVLTSLAGRSGQSATRAARAGLVDADDDALAACDVILSIVPPKDALALAQRLQPALHRAVGKPVYVDCNAVSPVSVAEIAAIVSATGTGFVDAGIIGPPPSDNPRAATTIYASGPAAPAFAKLNAFGLSIRLLDAPIGAASALKMAYAGLTKGFTALGAAMMLAASEAQVADALRRELSESQPHFLAFLERTVPGMFPKAYRWIAEMEEIAAFVESVPGGEGIYRGTADLYRHIAARVAAGNDEDPALSALREFCERQARASAERGA